jgi:C-terminal processing protease CtpA/Prc
MQAPDGPAAQQGILRRGDIVTTIDGVNVRGMSVVHARGIIMGHEGTSVRVEC